MWRRTASQVASPPAAAAFMALANASRSVMIRNHHSDITVKTKDAVYPATLSWTWKSDRPRHLVLSIHRPDDADASSASSFEDLDKDTERADKDYMFGRLFLRPINVAQILALLQGWSPKPVHIEREHTTLSLEEKKMPKSNAKTKKGASVPDSLPRSSFVLKGTFTTKSIIEGTHSHNSRNTHLDSSDGHPESVYNADDVRSIELQLDGFETSMLTAHLEGVLSSLFGIEHQYYSRITGEALQKQRQRLSDTRRHSGPRPASTSRYRSQEIVSAHTAAGDGRSTPLAAAAAAAAATTAAAAAPVPPLPAAPPVEVDIDEEVDEVEELEEVPEKGNAAAEDDVPRQGRADANVSEEVMDDDDAEAEEEEAEVEEVEVEEAETVEEVPDMVEKAQVGETGTSVLNETEEAEEMEEYEEEEDADVPADAAPPAAPEPVETTAAHPVEEEELPDVAEDIEMEEVEEVEEVEEIEVVEEEEEEVPAAAAAPEVASTSRRAVIEAEGENQYAKVQLEQGDNYAAALVQRVGSVGDFDVTEQTKIASATTVAAAGGAAAVIATATMTTGNFRSKEGAVVGSYAIAEKHTRVPVVAAADPVTIEVEASATPTTPPLSESTTTTESTPKKQKKGKGRSPSPKKKAKGKKKKKNASSKGKKKIPRMRTMTL